MDHVIVDRVDAIQAQAEAAHIKVALRETLYARRIADVAQNLVGESLLQLP